MTADERAETESRADRSKRRGELAQALAGYRSILTAFPDDAAVQRKLSELQDSIDPAELRQDTAAIADAAPQGPAQTVEQEGERLFALGDYPGALGAYRRAVAARPDNEMLKERLGEIFRLAQAAPGANTRSTRPGPGAAPSPVDTAGRYRALLERIAARRRT